MVPFSLALIAGESSHLEPIQVLALAEKVTAIPVDNEITGWLEDCKPAVVLLPAWLPQRRKVSMEILLWGKAPLVWLTDEPDPEVVKEALELDISGLLQVTDSTSIMAWTLELAYRTFKEKQSLRLKVQEINEALKTRKLVERAKTTLMETWGISEKEAHNRLQRQAMNSRRTLKAVAEAVLEAKGLVV